MLKNSELARKVVRVLVKKLPKEKEALLSTGNFIEFLAELYRKSRDARNFFVSPFVPKDKKLEFLRFLMEKFGAPSSVTEVLDYLLDINGFSLLPEMKRLYEHEVERIMRLSRGELYLAEELGDEEVNRIREAIQKALGRELDIEVEYDSSLIGGFVFKTPSFVVDASVRRQLEKLLVHGG